MISGPSEAKEPQMPESEVDERRVEREVEVPASREDTWRALTDPEQLGEWLADDAELDLRPGGELTVRTNGETREGFFEEIAEPQRLVFWWGEPDGELARVQIDLDEIEGGTRVRVVEGRPLVTVDVIGAGIEFEADGGAPQMSAVVQAVA
jgi:uncharacterized protein YndB with AHSA1/START domain